MTKCIKLNYYPTMSNGWINQSLSTLKNYYPSYQPNTDPSIISLPPETGDLSAFYYELIPGNLTVAFEECNLKTPMIHEMMALPVNDIYFLCFNDSEHHNTYDIDNQKILSGNGINKWLFSTATLPVTFTKEPNRVTRCMKISISRSYLMQLLQKLNLPTESKWWIRLKNNESFGKFFDLFPSDLKLEELIGEDCFTNHDNSNVKVHLLMLNVQRLIVLFLEKIFKTELPEVKIINRADHCKIQQVTEMMRLNLNKKYALDELSERSNMSASKFKKLFKAITKKSFSDFYCEIRMQEAVRQLTDDISDNMIEIALKLGYKDQSQFSKAFKEYYGYPPTQHVRNLPLIKVLNSLETNTI